MAEIIKAYEPGSDLTIFMAMGEVTYDELWKQARAFLTAKESRLVLWDMTLGSVAGISSRQMKQIAKDGSELSVGIKGARGAILTEKDEDYQMSRVFKTYSITERFPFEIEIFRDMVAAQKWLLSDSDDPTEAR